MAEDRIEIKDLLVRGIIGLNDWERKAKQDILINITLFTDLRAAGKSDNIEDTVNYGTLIRKVMTHIESAERRTVEALAEDVSRICLSMEGVRRARTRIEKPWAERFARSVGVEIEREAGGHT